MLEKLPLMALSVASCVVTYLVQASSRTVSEKLSGLARVQAVVFGYVHYLAMLAWPFNLTMRYARDQQVHLAATILCGVALTGVSAGVLFLCHAQVTRACRLVLVFGDDCAR